MAITFSPQPNRASRARGAGVTAVLVPTNTGKTHLAIERMLAEAFPQDDRVASWGGVDQDSQARESRSVVVYPSLRNSVANGTLRGAAHSE